MERSSEDSVESNQENEGNEMMDQEGQPGKSRQEEPEANPKGSAAPIEPNLQEPQTDSEDSVEPNQENERNEMMDQEGQPGKSRQEEPEANPKGSAAPIEPNLQGPQTDPASSDTEADGCDSESVAPPNNLPATQREVLAPGEMAPYTVLMQLGDTIPYTDEHQLRVYEAIETFRAMKPNDPAESALARLTIGLTNVGMQSLGRAATGHCSRAREQDIKLGIRSALATAELIKVLDSRRGGIPMNVNVGQVNVQSGGKAIVGNVAQPKLEDDRPKTDEDTDDGEEAA